MALIAGASAGFWLVGRDFYPHFAADKGTSVSVPCELLGGLSLVGPPLLLWDRRRRSPWNPGELLWFTVGILNWLIWPALVRYKYMQLPDLQSINGVFIFYVGPSLAALGTLLTLAASGRLRIRLGRRRRWSWRGDFGLALGLGWCVIGFLLLSGLYF